MASISKSKDGRRTIQFVGADRKRRSVRLGKVPQSLADSVKRRIELLNAAAIAGHAPDEETSRWVASRDAVMRQKLVQVGLVPDTEAPEKPVKATLGPFLDEYAKRRIDVKPATREVWRQVMANLKKHFGESRDIASITEGDADGFKLYLISEKLAPTTVAKRLQFARAFFRAAKRQKLIEANPFAEVSAKAVLRQDRQRFITREETDRLLEVCNPTWKVIVALCRYGGLRCPSEVLSLRWDAIDWANNRIVVASPKTEVHGKASRLIPLFAELYPILTDARELAPDGAVFVVDEQYRRSALGKTGWRNCNLRTQFERLVTRAGLTPWPRLFHALRASRETELARDFPIHVVTTWLGNTPKVALRHYLMTSEADFQRAARGGAESGAQAVQNPVQHSAEPCSTISQGSAVTAGKTTTCAVFSGNLDFASGEDRIRPGPFRNCLLRTGF